MPARRIHKSRPRRDRRGFALESTLLLLVLLGALVGVATAAMAVYMRTSGVDLRTNRATYAAEAAGDQLMAQLDAALSDGILTAGDITALSTPTMAGFTFAKSVLPVGTPMDRLITSGPFAGLSAFEQPMSINIEATDNARTKATIELGVTLQSIPIFQFGAFYEGDLEVTNGPPLTFTGWMHSNRNIYLSSPSATFLSLVTAADSVFWATKDDGSRFAGVRIANSAGALQWLDFDSRSDPGATFVTKSNTKFDGRLMSHASGVRPLRLPLPLGMNPIELIRPASGGDSPDVTAVRMVNKADLRIVVDLTAPLTNICSEATFTRTGGRTPLGAACAGIFTFQRNAFWDGREMRHPDVLELDMSALRTFVNSAPGPHQVSVLYVEFRGRDASGTVVARDYPALRIRNGSELPAAGVVGDAGGMSIVTNAALYVQGDFNTVAWKPAALMGDVATFLSNGWSDAASQVYPRPLTTTPTSVNAALLVGGSETSCDIAVCGGIQQFGGGLENLPRLLEDWGGGTPPTPGTAFNFTGSMVSLFVSAQATREWGHDFNTNPGGGGEPYYLPPTRNFQFETRFRNPLLLPPGTPRLGSVVKVSFRNVY
jgi:hypothetical protein